MLNLPQEITDSVIDWLSDDKPTLQACSGVSRGWLPRSRYYQFMSVSLRVGWDIEANRLEDFLYLISSPLVTFLECIDEVRLTHKWNSRDVGSSTPSPSETLAALEIRGIIPTRLYLDCRRHLSLPPDEAPPFAASVLHLELELDENYVAVDGIADYVCSFPRIQSLKIVGLPDDVNPARPSAVSLPAQLRTLYTGHKVFTDWLITMNEPPTQITTLGLVKVPSFQLKWSAVNRYLASSCTANLETIVFNDCHPSTGPSGGPDFRNLHRLKHIVIAQTHARAPSTLLSLLAFLQTAPDARRMLETITLTLTFLDRSGTHTYRTRQWLALDAALANSVEAQEYPRLRLLRITTSDEDGPELREMLGVLSFEAMDAVALVLHAHLGRCADHGLVRVEGIPIVPGNLPD